MYRSTTVQRIEALAERGRLPRQVRYDNGARWRRQRGPRMRERQNDGRRRRRRLRGDLEVVRDGDICVVE